MLGTGLLTSLIAKLAGLGSMAKIAVATTTAALTMTAVGATAGVLPFQGGHAGPGVIAGAAVQATTVPPPSTPPVHVGGGASVATSTGSSSPTPTASGAVATPAAPKASLSIPSLPVPAGALPDLSALTQIPSQVLSCLTPVLDLVKGLPTVSMGQIAQIGPKIVSCVSGIVHSLPLPFGLNACISKILGFVGNITSQLPTGTPSIGNLDLTACIPSGLPVPTGLPGLPFTGGRFPFGR